MSRRDDLDTFYQQLGGLARRVGGARRLAQCTGRQPWPERGVYFIFEAGELRADGDTPRVVRVGTHALKAKSRTTLWGRLAQHRGRASASSPGGNHRASVFRRHVGLALLNQGEHPEAADTWTRSRVTGAQRQREAGLEAVVSRTIGAMQVLWVAVDDPAGPTSRRGLLEANAIGLLSNVTGQVLDLPGSRWLGRWSPSGHVRASGLWNVHHVDHGYDPSFLEVFATAVAQADVG